MFCKKFFSWALLNLLAFSALGGVVPTSAMENLNEYENGYGNEIDEWFDDWCCDYSFNENINKKHGEFMFLLEQHRKLFEDCGITLNKDIKEVYKEIFRASFNDIFNNPMIPDSMLSNDLIPCRSLMNNSSIKVVTGFEINARTKDSRGATVSSYGYSFPCIKNNKKGNLVFTIKFAKSILYSVDLEFKPQ